MVFARCGFRRTGFGPKTKNDRALTAYRSGVEMLRRGDSETAEMHFVEAVEYAPNDPALINFVGFSQFTQLKVEAAKTNFVLAIELDPLYAPAHVGLGAISSYNKDYESSVLHHKRALSIDPRDALAHWGAGSSLWKLDRRAEAVGHLEIFIELMPESEFRSAAEGWIEKFENAID